MNLPKRDLVDLSRSVGGLLFAAGAVSMLARRPGHNGWSDFGRFLIVLAPTVVLYTLALSGRARGEIKEAQPWQSVLMVTAILFAPVVLEELLIWVKVSAQPLIYGAGVFALTGLLATYATWRARVRYTALLAGLSAIVAWLLIWGQILHHPSADTYRWLLVLGATLLLLGATRLARTGSIGANELATAGGLAAVSAGVLGVIVGAFSATLGRVNRILNSPTTTGPSSHRALSAHRAFSDFHTTAISNTRANHLPHFTSHAIPIHHVATNSITTTTSGLQHLGWDVYLLVVSLALIWIGARACVRGLGYVGGIGLLAFLASIAAQITRIETGHNPTTSLVGWPLALLVLGVAGLAASALPRRDT